MEHTVPMGLRHFGVDVVAGIAQFGDLFGEQFHTLGGITENDTLINLKNERKDYWKSVISVTENVSAFMKFWCPEAVKQEIALKKGKLKSYLFFCKN